MWQVFVHKIPKPASYHVATKHHACTQIHKYPRNIPQKDDKRHATTVRVAHADAS